ncbi:hypothetical protein PBI_MALAGASYROSE_39 [Mycobacterium phage MalagasyRose]|uniref:Uncharacterized protein n=1 Tax=Mycobacterium phage MalagasyRose TaxID=2599870 RepID=A0A5J6TGK6_9CAUD|nr:hypothetical protein QEH39_gp49 [Mycobacterium phage MalagasyRose]QFG08889.1 hypothetical protein PBI_MALAGASYROSE_39 [Mycobacterium phage MalagasyRose]
MARKAGPMTDPNVQILDALIGAEEILGILHDRGTLGLERESNAGRIGDVLHNVRDAQRLVATVAVHG